MVTSNIIHRTFQIKWQEKFGSCFTIDVDRKQYLCTAKHVLEGFNTGKIELWHEERWKSLEVEFVGYGSEGTDICVLSPGIQLSPALPLLPRMDNIVLGQEVYFLGFPYGLRTEMPDLNRFFPLPFVKQATLSAMILGEKKNILFLDGHNNPGFSGGPVVFKEIGSSNNELYVASIVAGYRSAFEPILDEKGNETPLRYLANTGIIISYSIKHALDAIRENPIGQEIRY